MDRQTARLQRTRAGFGYLARHAMPLTPKHPRFPAKAPGLNLETAGVIVDSPGKLQTTAEANLAGVGFDVKTCGTLPCSRSELMLIHVESNLAHGWAKDRPGGLNLRPRRTHGGRG